MKPRIVTKTAIAEDDIRDIATYIAFENPIAARQFGLELSIRLELLSEFPKIGHRVNGFAAELYLTRVSRRFRRYLVIYRLLDDGALDVVRVLHGVRDVAAELAQLK